MECLLAGEWRSPAFLKYLDLYALERDAVVQAHLEESEDEDEQECAVAASAVSCSGHRRD